MRTYGSNLPVKERWIKIAEVVQEKSAKQCYERFKELCALIKQQ